MIERTADPDQSDEISVQAARPPMAAIATASGMLRPPQGRLAMTRKTAMQSATSAAAHAADPGKNPPSRSERYTVSAAGSSASATSPAVAGQRDVRASTGASPTSLICDQRGARG